MFNKLLMVFLLFNGITFPCFQSLTSPYFSFMSVSVCRLCLLHVAICSPAENAVAAAMRIHCTVPIISYTKTHRLYRR